MIGVADVAHSFRWHQVLLGQSESELVHNDLGATHPLKRGQRPVAAGSYGCLSVRGGTDRLNRMRGHNQQRSRTVTLIMFRFETPLIERCALATPMPALM